MSEVVNINTHTFASAALGSSFFYALTLWEFCQNVLTFHLQTVHEFHLFEKKKKNGTLFYIISRLIVIDR